MNIIKKIILAPYAAYSWTKALSLASNERYEQSLELLERIEPFYEKNDAEYNIFRGFIEFSTKWDIQAIRSFESGIKLLNTSKRYTENEKKYLECYVSGFIKHIVEHKDIQCNLNILDSSCEEVKLAEVRLHIRRKYPVTQK